MYKCEVSKYNEWEVYILFLVKAIRYLLVLNNVLSFSFCEQRKLKFKEFYTFVIQFDLNQINRSLVSSLDIGYLN